MDPLSHSTRRIPRLVLHPLNRAPQTRLYTLETLNRQLRQAARPKRAAARHRTPSLNKVEAFGKPRDPSSHAAKAERFKESRQIEKALKHENHGENVYAYVHISTGQVVYSLTRIMDNHQMLSQLVFHGKKTVPASLRRDLWTPYFSLHLPSSHTGLLAYQRLRELSLQRQLSPPDSLVMTTKERASKAMRARMSKEQEETWDEEREGKEYRDGLPRLMFRRERAKALMQQKATSVADVAFVIDLMQQEGHLLSPSRVEDLAKANQARRIAKAPKRRRKKFNKMKLDQERRREMYEEKIRQVQEGTKWGLEKYAAKRIALEHGGVIIDSHLGRTKVLLPGREGAEKEDMEDDMRVTKELSDASSPESNSTESTALSLHNPSPPPLEIRIFWSDLRDAAYAVQWPEIVSHGELERMAVGQMATLHRRGQLGARHFADRSVHVIGAGKVVGNSAGESWMRGSHLGGRALQPREESYVGGDAADDGGAGAGGDGGGGGGGDSDAQKSREEQTQELDREGVVVVDSPSRRRGLWGWAKGRLGLAS